MTVRIHLVSSCLAIVFLNTITIKNNIGMANMNSQNNIEKKEIFTEKEAALYISMSRSFLSQDRMNGTRNGRTIEQDFVKLGRAVRYRKDDLDSWLLKNRVRTRIPPRTAIPANAFKPQANLMKLKCFRKLF